MRKMVLLILSLGIMGFLSCGQKEMMFRMESGGGGESQTEIQGPDGRRVFIDVISNDFPSSPFTEQDLLIVTHGHPDHRNIGILNSFPGEMILMETAERKYNGLEIKVIPSAHNKSDELKDLGSTNYLVWVKTGGMVFLHTGDCGQDSFTDEQLKEIGRVDVYVGQLENFFSNVSMSNRKGFVLIGQLDPKLVIPNHYGKESLAYAAENYPMYSRGLEWITVNEDNLPKETTFLVTGRKAADYQQQYDLLIWK